MFDLRRRDFIALLGGAAAWPLAARAQPARPVPIVGLVSIAASATDAANFRGFLEQMRELGYVDGANIIFDKRFAGGREELIDSYVADLVRRPVDIIVVTGTRESLTAMRATSSIPIVTIVAPDPIAMGLAQSLARPGGNITGLTTMDLDIYGKRLELLGQAVPGLRKAAILISPDKPLYRTGSPWASAVGADARSLGLTLHIVEADETNLDGALSSLIAAGTQGLVVSSDGVFLAHRQQLVDATIRHRLPAIFAYRPQADAGGLMAYAARVDDLSRRAAFFVDRILKGAKPADLPIEQPTRFTLVLNLRTAKIFGLDLPAALLAQADEVIE
jgi:putative ABC transport system substrate-binding protein